MHIACIFERLAKNTFFAEIFFAKNTSQYICQIRIKFVSLQTKSDYPIPAMTAHDFTDILLPHLIQLYTDGQLPLHALVDIDLWQQIFPERRPLASGHFHWYEVSLTCNPLQDQTLLLSFILPQPLVYGDPKFASIRIDPQSSDSRRSALYTLHKPASIFDNWSIRCLHFTADTEQTQQPSVIQMIGTDSLRNFVLAVQQIPFL